MQHITVTLSEAQCEEVREIGRARQGAKTTEGKAADRSGAQIHVAGFAAEYALALLLGVEPNRNVSPHGTDGISLRAKGATFNTKWVSKSWYDLKYWPEEVTRVEFMVLCDGSLPDIRLVGWVSRSQFRSRYEEKNLPGQGSRWLVERDKLNPMIDLFGALGIAVPPPIARAKRRKMEKQKRKEEQAKDTPEPDTFPGLLEEDTHDDPA